MSAFSWSFVFCLMLFSMPASAETSLEFGGVAGHFHYEESSSSGDRLNRESGVLPGLYGAFVYRLPLGEWFKVSATRYSGDVRYEGQSQSGVPLRSRSDAALWFADATAGWRGVTHSHLIFVPMVRLGYREWQRDILPTDFTRKLSENYRWFELGVGGSLCYPERVGWLDSLCAEGWAIYTFDGSVKVDLTELGAGQPKLRLGARPGAAIRFLATVGSLEFSLFGQLWKFGSSEPESVDWSSGKLVIEEPASQSWLAGLSLGFQF